MVQVEEPPELTVEGTQEMVPCPPGAEAVMVKVSIEKVATTVWLAVTLLMV